MIILIYLIKIDNINVATAVVLFSYRTNITTNLMEKVGNLLTEIKTFNLSSKRVFAMFDNIEFKKEEFGIKHLDKVNGDFEFKDVTFSYDNDKKVLDKLSFKVNANETVGFVGKSGVGKTTIFNLLCKMYDVNDGCITIDGVDIKELDEDSIRGNITIISQNPYIFNLSIRENLRLVKSDLTDEEMIYACKLACLDDFINTLPDKYDTVVGEAGVTLSGGQRQRLAIARAFIQRTEIILFDEATSALDNDTQNKIQQAMSTFEKVQQHLYILADKQGEESETAIKIGTIMTFSLLQKFAGGKKPSELSSEDWKDIAETLFIASSAVMMNVGIIILCITFMDLPRLKLPL